MAKQTADRAKKPVKFDTPSARAALTVQRNPHWQKVRVNRFIGYRKMDAKRPGTWTAKARVNGIEHFDAMGSLEQYPEEQRYDRALALANKWFAAMDKQVVENVSLANFTIHHAINAYLKAILENQTKYKARDAKAAQAKHDYTKNRFDLLVMPFVLPEDADRKEHPQWVHRSLIDLTKKDFQRWREWMTALPTDPKRSGRTRHGHKRTKETVRRDIASFRAALNWARHEHEALHDTWRSALTQERVAGQTAHNKVAPWKIMPMADRKKLIDAAREIEPDFVPFLVAHLIVPVRPGAFAQMKAASYLPEDNTLMVGHDKVNGDRHISLPHEHADVFAAAVKGKLPGAFLFTTQTGVQWNAGSWRRAFIACRDHAGLDKRWTMYCLRHSRITDLIYAGRPVMEIAQLAGTSVAMIEQTYFQAQAEKQREALSVPGW